MISIILPLGRNTPLLGHIREGCKNSAVLNEMKERLAKCQGANSWKQLLPYIGSNSLRTVPDFSAFTALQELELRGNQLRELNDTNRNLAHP
ncbi:hypothetical protein Pelo_17078 [Pelomyxa schiedti]|nr:hypothetical protein Pelo_17078 [Pelomyxa schiedti]